jgi:hypothetical protein
VPGAHGPGEVAVSWKLRSLRGQGPAYYAGAYVRAKSVPFKAQILRGGIPGLKAQSFVKDSFSCLKAAAPSILVNGRSPVLDNPGIEEGDRKDGLSS